MMDLNTIVAVNNEIALKAAKEDKHPYVPLDPREVDGWLERMKIPLPNLGYYEPPGWTELPDLRMFVDSSGWGAPGEPALTLEQFIGQAKAIVEEHPGMGFAIVEEGQFQVYVGVFRKTKSTDLED